MSDPNENSLSQETGSSPDKPKHSAWLSGENIAIKSAYDFGKPNEGTSLASDFVAFSFGKETYTGEAEIGLVLLPRARIQVDVRLDDLPFAKTKDVLEEPISITLKNRSLEIPGFATSVTGPTKTGTRILLQPRQEPIQALGQSSTLLTRVVFHLFNFNEFLAESRSLVKVGRGQEAIEHVYLKNEHWAIHVHSLGLTRKHLKTLKAQGGYALTHVGDIEKNDGTGFKGEEASDILEALRFFLSFAKGGWCCPVCAVGFEADEKRVWEQWSSPRQPWQSPSTWFDSFNSQQLVDLFPGFMDRWSVSEWRAALREVLYWYFNSNDSCRGIDAGIILTQAAIERLSFEYAVRDRRLIESKGFSDLRASDKFRLLFSSLDIPIEIPTTLSNLNALGESLNWLDAPQALTEVRNSLVHPAHKRRGQFDQAYFDTWNLGLWFLELALLRICGYVGSYSNRLTSRYAGEVEDVPWR